MLPPRIGLLVWVALIHLTGIYLFTKGFLLTRLSLSDFTTCSDANCGITPTHKRAIFIIIDALRFDFISPNPPIPRSPFHHDILTLPRQLTAQDPSRSLIFNAYADPPTTTLQRIKGITTGSLPTFVDMGNNFGGSSIAEDSILKQLKLTGKKLAFMGDDTWMSVFPDAFEPNMTFPFDSFDVEDLHTVDEGVIKHIFPLLEDATKPFDFLIGHFLGVDHVGHRVGPDHPSMKAKLRQMNEVLERVVQQMDEDTLLVVLGDHGMNRSGDHGGDGVLETSAGIWIYSKGQPLTDTSSARPSGLLQFKAFPQAEAPHRSIQQIDILPTISLLLGTPIPFNNLGTVIPELFWRGNNRRGTLEKALEVNAAQIMTYLDTYRSSSSGSELDDAWQSLQNAWNAIDRTQSATDSKLVTLVNFNRVALAACRAMWAQFNPFLMSLGLSILSLGLCASWAIYNGFEDSKQDWAAWLSPRLWKATQSSVVGALVGAAALFCVSGLLPGVSASQFVLFFASLASTVTMIIVSAPKITSETLTSTPIILILHAVAFLSNSFTFWEDRIVPFLLVTSIVPYVLRGFSAPNTRLRYRILGFSLLFTVCVRLMAISTICREEQQPYCHVTFFASSSLPSPPIPVLYLSIPVAIALPYFIERMLHITLADSGVSKTHLRIFLTPTLLAGALYWIMEWADSASVLGEGWAALLRGSRTWIARMSFVWMLAAGGALWSLVPLCLDIQTSFEGEKRQVTIVGYANAFGSPYLIFWGIFLGIVYICTQLTGQVVLALATVALVAFLEVLDSVRDARSIEAAFASATPSSVLDPAATLNFSPSIQFADIVPISLLGLLAFYGTGHQSTITSLQWKTAFLLTPTFNYMLSAFTVVSNSLGPVFLFALAAPLAGLWNRAPLMATKEEPNVQSDVQAKNESTKAALGIMMYYLALLLGTAVSAAVLRRHLMVWKVFAPRFMTAALELLAVDVAVLIGVGLGLERITSRLARMFRGRPTSPPEQKEK
ncbi:hypothetical protein CPC08DRAFT_670686 [Agrocybe pediades]|nr:hypothetical protein CPC08DRAFT_670686 [Agrocybe pediades]